MNNLAPTLPEWTARIADRSARIGIVGLGYVGLPLTLLFSEERFAITGFDIDPEKVAKLNRAESYIHRIEPEHLLAAQAAGFRATTDFAAARELDAVLICVPTPLHPDHTPDMSFVVATIEALAPHLRAGQLVVLESTTYPGTTEEIIVATIERHGAKVLRGEGHELDGVMVAFSPEREDPGNMTTPRRDIPKVVGGVDARATEAACALYGAVFNRTVPMSSTAAAEMTKLLENIYRCVNIALVNEMKQLCLHLGLDIWEVIGAAATKPFGFQPFYPGPGVGGHCIPVDPFYLSWKAKQFGFETRFIELAGEVNESMPGYVVETARRALERNGVAIKGAKILILGVAYKRDVDDLRESPALVIIDLLRRVGAEIRYNDPFFATVGSGRHYDLRMESAPLDDLARYDCVLIVTDHSAYDYADIVRQSKLVVDSRNATRGLESSKIVRC
ncbi:UDP-N-acetyl-D-glucosamine dehydrogenase [Granulicella rosea]|uniref:UDP-N-acetyl-D-glucosamine dehydrogenase n=1 Tax=Granulicella rosea TaxID=474952 RepID=A0A239DIP7_9BACT|nr:nucleotide sugar dehydrogenase [Granulicella rosea]SNS31822.1 UDP-N-acetyl-D-glucosamine dehydrogenase [Granulicella rosea]